MKTIIERIISGENVEAILTETMNRIFTYGPTDPSDLEALTYIKIYRPEIFEKHEKSIVFTMGLFFKNPEVQTFRDIVFDIYNNDVDVRAQSTSKN